MRFAWLAPALVLTVQQMAFGQSEPTLPAWLASYPDAAPQTKTFRSLVESTYTTPAATNAVTDHYRRLFEAQNLPFLPNSDGMGAVIRGTAAECDLLLAIRAQGKGTFVQVDCAARSTSNAAAATWTALPESNVTTPSRVTPRTGPSGARVPHVWTPAESRAQLDRMVAEGDASYRQHVKELGIHKVYHDAPAPPLIWPSWLVHLKGAKLSIQRGVDPSKRDYLEARFVTNAPMTAIRVFYEDLLKANDYSVYRAKLETGQTISGLIQNADGYVEGSNYPNGHPGAYTVIHVSFSRFALNDPIKVNLRFTTYDYKAPPPFEP